VISGIAHMLECGGRWQDCPSDYGSSTTVYNRWIRRGIWGRILAALIEEGWIAKTAQMEPGPLAYRVGAG
jgi:transposase